MTPACSPWWLDQRVARIAVYASSLLALAVCLANLLRPGVLFGIDEYDDGVYLGAAIRLAHGHLPYHSFDFPHPPGVPLLFAPLAFIGRIGSTRTLMAMARVVSAVVATGNVFLIGRILRHRGLLAVLAGSLGLAAFPLAMAANKTVLIEPYVVLFSLLGISMLFEGDKLSRNRRLFWAGVAFGFALTVKLWAAIPLLVVFVVVVPRWRATWRMLGSGLLIGGVLPCLPFFLSSPVAFVRQVVTLQLERGPSNGSLPWKDRLVLTTGIRPFWETEGANREAIALGLAFVLLVVICFLVRGRLFALDGVLVGAAALGVFALMKSADYFTHYSYFSAALLAPAGGAAFGAFACALTPRPDLNGHDVGERSRFAPLGRSAIAGVLVLCFLAAATAGVISGQRLADRAPIMLTLGDSGPVIAAAIPRGACVVSDVAALTITANRFVADRNCPAMVDSFYSWLVADPRRPPPDPGPYSAALVARWQAWFEAADYVVLADNPFRVPWSTELKAWFDTRFEVVAQPWATVYRKVDRSRTADPAS